MAAMAATPIPDKLKEKTDQHTQLMDLLKKGGYKAEFCPIILGVGDAVYKSNLASLNFLGVKPEEAQTVLNKPHTRRD